MSNRKLDDWLSSYLKLVDNSEPPTLFKIWAGISTICAVLQRKCFLRWSMWDTIYPNMYIVLVGPSGSRKGTAMGPAKSMLKALGVNLCAESITREALIRLLANSSVSDVDPGSNGSIITSHCSLTIFSEELTVFLGQSNNGQLISDLNNWFDCLDTWKYQTKNQGEDEIIGVWVNLFGATTPEFIQSALPPDAIGGGLTSRIVFVFGDRKSKLCPTPFFTDDDLRLQGQLIHDLEKIMMLNGEFKFTDEYLQAYVKWYKEQAKNPRFTDDNFAGYNDRRALHLRKLSMVLSVSHSDDMVLQLEDFERALTILDETEKFMPFVFSGRGRLPTAQILDRIVRDLLHFGELKGRDLMKRYMKDVTIDDLEQMVRTLEKSGIAAVHRTGSDFVLKAVGFKKEDDGPVDKIG